MLSHYSQACQHFRALQQTSQPLILANAWDTISARILELSGAPAIATSSCAISWVHGYADGSHLPLGLHLQSVAAIKRVISVPLSVDLEAGYSDNADQVAQHVAAFIAAGAVAINIEDGSQPAELLAEKILAIRQHCGPELFINARTDLVLQGQFKADALIEQLLVRAELYQAAGADALFVPGLQDLGLITTLCQRSALPVNVMALPDLPAASRLQQAGVQRISMGGFLLQAALAQTQQLVRDSLASGEVHAMFAQSLDYGSLNQALSAVN